MYDTSVFPQTLRDMQVSYVPSAAHLSVRRFGSALPNLHSAIFAPVQFHKKKNPKKHHNLIKEFPRVEYDKWESDSNDFHLLSLQFKYGPEMTAVPGYCSSNCVLSHSSVNSEARLPGPQ